MPLHRSHEGAGRLFQSDYGSDEKGGQECRKNSPGGDCGHSTEKRPELMEKAGRSKRPGKTVSPAGDGTFQKPIPDRSSPGAWTCKKGGGRVAARPHIAPAEESGIRQLEEEIERGSGMDDLVKMMEETGLPFAYDHFEEGEAAEPPFVCYLLPQSNHFSADGKVYLKITEVHIELYTDCKDLSAEQKVEAVLDKQGIFFMRNRGMD